MRGQEKFEFKLENTQGGAVVETLHGEYVEVRYYIKVAVNTAGRKVSKHQAKLEINIHLPVSLFAFRSSL